MKNLAGLTLFFFTLSIQLSSCSQQEKKINCNDILKTSPYIFRELKQSTMNQDSVNNDYAILRECGNLDSIDGIIFQGPVLGQLLVKQTIKENFKKGITYQDLIDLISQFKTDNSKLYQKLRAGTINRLEIEKMPVVLKEFESIRPKLYASGLTQEEINDFKSFLDANHKDWNYKQAMTAFSQSKESTISSNRPLDFPRLETLEKALDEAKKANKNCLIYFSGWGCVNARKFEEQLLKDSNIQQTIQANFIYRVAYVDEREKLPDGSSTIGETQTKLQIEKFKSTSQPALFIMTPDGKIIASWTYENGADAFNHFLDSKK